MHIAIESISQIHKAMGLAPPSHPLISIMDMGLFQVKENWINNKYISSLYTITLKDASCGMEYGRNTYDFQEGVISFIAPQQVFSLTNKPHQKINGWMLNFHPELIRNTSLGEKMHQYNFFSYDVYEALHLSLQEQAILTDCISILDQEIHKRIDRHSQGVIVSGLEFFFNFCTRFYERQFHTRSSKNKDILSKVESSLRQYYTNGLHLQGLPTVKYLAQQVNLSPGYLSDLLKSETGKTAKEHINFHLIEKAKTILLATSSSISEIAYDLGFEYPQHFSKMFKLKTGMSPTQYRILN